MTTGSRWSRPDHPPAPDRAGQPESGDQQQRALDRGAVGIEHAERDGRRRCLPGRRPTRFRPGSRRRGRSVAHGRAAIRSGRGRVAAVRPGGVQGVEHAEVVSGVSRAERGVARGAREGVGGHRRRCWREAGASTRPTGGLAAEEALARGRRHGDRRRPNRAPADSLSDGTRPPEPAVAGPGGRWAGFAPKCAPVGAQESASPRALRTVSRASA